MLNRLRALNPLRYDFLVVIEGGLIGLCFIQALRFLTGMLYSRTASASLVSAYARGTINPAIPGVVDPAVVSQEIALLGLVIALPLLTLILGRVRYMFIAAALMTAVGRVLMLANSAGITPVMAAELTVGGALLYLAMLIRSRARVLPYFFIVALGIDGLLRAYGNTLDPSWLPGYITLQINNNAVIIRYLDIQIILSILIVLFSLITALPARRTMQPARTGTGSSTGNENRGILTLPGAIGLGAMLFLQMSLLSLPNAIGGRADADYTTFVPIVMAATLLPLVPFVRKQARNLIAPFDPATRGWIWLVVLILLLVIGMRVQRITAGQFEVAVGGAALAAAQFMITLVWWWFAPPQGDQKRNFTGLWLVITPLVFALLVACDLFTYEYAFVRNLAPPFDMLNDIVPPLLRGFRDMGLFLTLLAAFLTILPMIQSASATPPWWRRGSALLSFFTLVLVVAGSAAAGVLARPPLIQPVLNVAEIRVGTYNIHSGYSEFFNYNPEDIASAILASGADVVLLQEVEAGRITSFGVDQTLWLARRLQMDRRYFPTIEGLHGLAVLSKVPIVFDDGVIIPGVDRQTGLQRVQIRPDESAVTLYNTSLGFLLQGSSIDVQEGNQTAQLTTILATIDAHVRQPGSGGQPGRMILGGTFNNVPDSPLLIKNLANTGFIDPFAGSNLDLSATLVRVDRRARVDYLWLWSQSLSSTGNGVIDNPASDHRLAFAGVQIRRGN